MSIGIEFSKKADAAKYLKAKGMKKNMKISNRGREYWHFDGSRPEKFYDHSATITPIGGGVYHVSDFSELEVDA